MRRAWRPPTLSAAWSGAPLSPPPWLAARGVLPPNPTPPATAARDLRVVRLGKGVRPAPAPGREAGTPDAAAAVPASWRGLNPAVMGPAALDTLDRPEDRVAGRAAGRAHRAAEPWARSLRRRDQHHHRRRRGCCQLADTVTAVR